jgi:hypothetical protein
MTNTLPWLEVEQKPWHQHSHSYNNLVMKKNLLPTFFWLCVIRRSSARMCFNSSRLHCFRMTLTAEGWPSCTAEGWPSCTAEGWPSCTAEGWPSLMRGMPWRSFTIILLVCIGTGVYVIALFCAIVRNLRGQEQWSIVVEMELSKSMVAQVR